MQTRCHISHLSSDIIDSHSLFWSNLYVWDVQSGTETCVAVTSITIHAVIEALGMH